jgi:hypothetical protein
MTFSFILVLITIMLVTGIVGGIVGYVSRAKASQENREWWKYVAVGAGAAFIVPLFLNAISSNLIETIVDKDGQYQAAELLTIVDICLLSSILLTDFCSPSRPEFCKTR